MFWFGLWSGCSEQHLSYASAREVCASRYFPSEAAEPVSDPSGWGLRERWTSDPAEYYVSRVAAAPFSDTDGDGAIGAGDRMDVVSAELSSSGFSDSEVRLVDGSTGATRLVMAGDTFDIADVDPSRPGPEIVVGRSDEEHAYTVSIADRDGPYLEATLVDERGAGWGNTPVVDLEGDGLLEWVGGRGVYDLASGAPRFSFGERRIENAAVADLDGDGRSEVVVHLEGEDRSRFYQPDGTVSATCPIGIQSDFAWSVAIGNLDEDPALEVVQGGVGGLFVCDADGTVLAETDEPVYGAISIAELDADPTPELVVGAGNAILGLQHDLTPIAAPPVLTWGAGQTVADLDRDGIHEILSWTPSSLTITRATGTPIAYLGFGVIPGTWGYPWLPMVADLDADGLAEIVVPDWSSPGVTVIDNALGGWAVDGADAPWRGYPGNDAASSAAEPPTVIGPDAFVGTNNVWNGRPAVVGACSAAVDLELRDVCVDHCDGDATLTAYVANRGALPLGVGLEVEIRVDGAVVGSAPVPPVGAEEAAPVQISLPARRLVGTIEAALAGPGTADCTVPASRWDEPICR